MLSVCMIVKNEAENLKLTLPQLVKHAAEVIVVDTGSTDNTVEVAKSLGARVGHFSWVNDFAAARNHSLSLATQPWIAWLDADEYLKEEDLVKLLEILKKSSDEVMAYQLILTESPFGETKRGNSYARVKVFRNSWGNHFIRPINEQVVDKEGKTIGGKDIPVVIYHWGRYLNENSMQKKRERYLKMYRDFLSKNPSDPYVNYLLGNLLRDEGNKEEAYAAYTNALAGNRSDVNLQIDLLTRKAELALKLGKHQEAFQATNQAIKLDPENVGARNILATLLIGVGKPDLAVQILEEVLNSQKSETTDPVRQQLVPCTVLAKAYRDMGDIQKSEHYEGQVKELEAKIDAYSAK